MTYGPVPLRQLPKQDSQKSRLMVDRWYRGHQAMESWATGAKQCVDFFEGRQWTADQLAKLAKESRPALVFNKIAPLVRLVVGYMRNNRSDIRYLPGNEGGGTGSTAEILSRVAKQIGEQNQLPWVDAEVFLDAILTGRGYYDIRLDFERNDLGEVCISAVDPFSVILDPDATSYDTNEHASITKTKWLSLDEVEVCYGPEAAKLIRPFIGTNGGATWGGFPFLDMSGPEITPIRTFGQTDDPTTDTFRNFFHSELIDSYRKSVRVIDQQHRVTTWGPCFIDLETGDRVPVPGDWNQVQIEKAVYHAQRIGNPIVVQNRPYKRVRWTVMIGDVMVHDDWSPYENYTIGAYFPYFRRGITRGMVADMIDPQMEINKRRSSQIEIVTRSSNTGWILNRDSLTNEQADNFKRNASKSGFIGEYRGDPTKKPERIQPNPPAMAMERLEQKSEEDLRTISGINESALGELDRVQSGRAIEARQRQAVIAIQIYMDNFARSKELLGRRMLELVQKHYTEERMFRIMGEDGRLSTIIINQKMMDPTGQTPLDRINDITVGKYTVAIDETPLSSSFASAQFEEMLTLLEKMGPAGALVAQARPDLIVELSSLPRKEEWANAIKQAMGMQPQGAPPGGMPPGGPGQPVDPAMAGGGANVIPLQPGASRAAAQ